MKPCILAICFLWYGFAQCQPAQQHNVRTNTDTAYQYGTPSSGGTGKFYMGREIALIMHSSGADWLERSNRPQQENTELIVNSMQLTPEMKVADIGAGTGYYTFRIAAKVPQGKVYAVELQDELIDILNKKRRENKIGNVEVIRGDTLRVNLPDSSIDLAIMVDVYHELTWPREIIGAISRSLVPGGRLLLVEYRGEDPEVRIKPLHKTTVAQLTREMRAHGFVLERRVNELPIQHFLVFRRMQ